MDILSFQVAEWPLGAQRSNPIENSDRDDFSDNNQDFAKVFQSREDGAESTSDAPASDRNDETDRGPDPEAFSLEDNDDRILVAADVVFPVDGETIKQTSEDIVIFSPTDPNLNFQDTENHIDLTEVELLPDSFDTGLIQTGEADPNIRLENAPVITSTTNQIETLPVAATEFLPSEERDLVPENIEELGEIDIPLPKTDNLIKQATNLFPEPELTLIQKPELTLSLIHI